MSSAILENKQSTKLSEWFEDLIQKMRIDELKLNTNTADKHTKDMYEALMSDDIFKALEFSSIEVQKIITGKLFKDFLNELFNKSKTDLRRIAFDLSGQQLMVWAVINDDDDKAEEKIYLAESLVNSRYRKLNYSVFATVLENGDNLEIPLQYRELNFSKKINA